MKLGSLFDGSGGFPLAGSLCGITPIWASEIEPYPIAVTTSRFPTMRHYGDVSKVNGAEVEPVDVLTFGSPCQDLSVAGKRAGLKHEANGDDETTRSGLFMEAVRIIKEMRQATNGLYPTFALWENVPGAFSSNGGDDFRVVLEELIKIVEPGATVPAVSKNGWPYADAYMGDGWSIAYRTLDAQYWGVPQRRRRIYLVADFRGERAAEILFEREGLQRYFEKGRTPWEGITSDAQSGAGADDRERDKSGIIAVATQQGGAEIFQNGKCPTITAAAGMSGNNQPWVCFPKTENTLAARHDGSPQPDKGNGANIVCYAAAFKGGQGSKARSIGYQEQVLPSLAAEAGGNSVPSVLAMICDARGNGDGKTAATITGDHENRVTDYSNVICLQGNGIDRADTAGCNGKGWKENVSYTLNTIDRPAVAYVENPICVADHPTPKVDCNGKAFTINSRDYKAPLCAAFAMQGFGDYKESDTASGLKARDYKDATDLVCETAEKQPVFTMTTGSYTKVSKDTAYTLLERGYKDQDVVCAPPYYIVRRLTPTECARLQGFPDTWGHPDHKDNLTDDEYHFWLDVRNTHAAINGKQTKDYTRDQILTWYNNLHTDSAEYKMWGNGIALPTALYVMQGIADKLRE